MKTARIPHADRHGLVWLSRGALRVEDGTLRFQCAGSGDLAVGDYAVPFQTVSLILLGPGSTVSHDALHHWGRTTAGSPGGRPECGPMPTAPA